MPAEDTFGDDLEEGSFLKFSDASTSGKSNLKSSIKVSPSADRYSVRTCLLHEKEFFTLLLPYQAVCAADGDAVCCRLHHSRTLRTVQDRPQRMDKAR